MTFRKVSGPIGYVTVELSPKELLRLQKGVTASGGLNDLLRAMQRGIRIRSDQTAVMTISTRELEKVVRYWTKTGGRPGAGGYQSRIPIHALAPYLPSTAPLFLDVAVPVKAPTVWVYFKREGLTGEPKRIKIGRGSDRRASTGRSTDNPRELHVLARVPEPPPERYYHEKFDKFRIRREQEWFWPDDDLLAFIEDLKRAQSG